MLACVVASRPTESTEITVAHRQLLFKHQRSCGLLCSSRCRLACYLWVLFTVSYSVVSHAQQCRHSKLQRLAAIVEGTSYSGPAFSGPPFSAPQTSHVRMAIIMDVAYCVFNDTAAVRWNFVATQTYTCRSWRISHWAGWRQNDLNYNRGGAANRCNPFIARSSRCRRIQTIHWLFALFTRLNVCRSSVS